MVITSQFSLATALNIVLLSSTALGQALTQNWNPNGDGCVDSAGFLSCYSNLATKGASCLDGCDNNNVKGSQAYTNCVSGCNGVWLAGNLGCWLQSCWNQVYSCQYQITAASYFNGTSILQNTAVPFYPPPDNASAGACSCNLGYVYGNYSVVTTESESACIGTTASGTMQNLFSCECCAFSVGVSNILNACPNSDLSIINFSSYIKTVQTEISQSSDQCAILNNGTQTCISEWKVPYVGDKAYNPLSLPSGEPGTEPLTNQAGNAFTIMGSPTTTLSLFPAYTSTITFASFNAKAAGADLNSITASSPVVVGTGSGGVVATGTQKVTATGTGTGSVTSATKASFASKMKGSFLALSLSLAISVLIL